MEENIIHSYCLFGIFPSFLHWRWMAKLCKAVPEPKWLRLVLRFSVSSTTVQALCFKFLRLFVYTGRNRLYANLPIFIQQSNILKWLMSLKLFSLTSTRGRNAPCSFISSPRCSTEYPLQARLLVLGMNDSSQMWSVRWSLLVFVYMKTPFMFDESELRQIAHLLHQIILSMWGVMSGQAASSTWEAGGSFPESMLTKMWHTEWIIKWHVLSFPPPHLADVIGTTL